MRISSEVLTVAVLLFLGILLYLFDRHVHDTVTCSSCGTLMEFNEYDKWQCPVCD